MPRSTYSDKYLTFRTLLADARRKMGLTQHEVAARLGKPQSFVSKYEAGERRLDVVEFVAVASAVGVDPVEILRRLLPRLPGGTRNRAGSE